MLIRKAEHADLPALLQIYNDAIADGTVTLDIHPRTLEDRQAWFDAHNAGNHPLYVAEEDGRVIGYTSLSGYRPKEAYAATVEISIYVDKDARQQGVATKLYRFILDLARADDSIHNVISVITKGNEASVRLHEKFGFVYCGEIPDAAEKCGKKVTILTYCLLV